MTLGAMTWTCLLLTAASPPEVIDLNSRKFQIPVRIDAQKRGEIQELDLYVSHDQGQTWQLDKRIGPDKEFFPYVAREDGPYWFTVAMIDRQGRQTPQDIQSAPVGQRILVDTVRPDIKLNAERQGDVVRVDWAIVEEHPKAESLKLEYAESADGPWTTVAIKPGPTGRAEFQTAAAVTVRMQMVDKADNQGTAIKQVAGVDGGTAVAAAAPLPPPPPPPLDPTPTAPLPPPDPPGPPPAEPAGKGPKWTARPADPTPMPAAAPAMPSPLPPPGSSMQDVPPARADRGGGNQVVAYSQQPAPAPAPQPAPAPSPYGPDPAAPMHSSLPPVQVVNRAAVKLEFDVGKVGPSGLGGVDVWVTTDDGATWDGPHADASAVLPSAGDAPNGGPMRGSVTAQLSQEGVTYGYYVVVKSKAGLGKPNPRPGDLPQVRVELDTTPPDAQLIKPEPDPTQPDTLLLPWDVKDKHLTANPITLEWAAQPDGPWNVIGAPELPNSGSVRWRPPANVPPSVYLRLTARDTAGNRAVAQTPHPVLIDLSVPEVTNIGLGGVSVGPADPR